MPCKRKQHPVDSMRSRVVREMPLPSNFCFSHRRIKTRLFLKQSSRAGEQQSGRQTGRQAGKQAGSSSNNGKPLMVLPDLCHSYCKTHCDSWQCHIWGRNSARSDRQPQWPSRECQSHVREQPQQRRPVLPCCHLQCSPRCDTCALLSDHADCIPPLRLSSAWSSQDSLVRPCCK